MKRGTSHGAWVANCLGTVACSLSLLACGVSTDKLRGGTTGTTTPDMTPNFVFADDGGNGTDDMGPQTPDVCGDPNMDPTCTDTGFGPPTSTFPLQSDPMMNAEEQDNGVNRNGMGYLGLDSTHTVFNYLWIANASDNNSSGTVSKIDSKLIREVARYLTVTCYSNKSGSTAQCDGTNGCCTNDDWYIYQARKAKMALPKHQAIQQTLNYPSRTSVDFNGDLFISNRAFGGQSSVSKVANTPAECIDRNKNGKIDTSSDVNGDGFIQEDCNGDGMPDDIAGVKAKPCTNGKAQEFYGTDDECILWTTNTFPNLAIGRPLGLAAGAADSNVSDAWAGSFQYGQFERIDGTTGMTKDDTLLPHECYGSTGPYGLAVDSQGIGWTPNLGSGKLCYFDTNNPASVGSARDPQWGQMEGYGVTMDRDQNVWVGMGVERYTPDRSNGFNSLGNGFWTKITNANGIGIAADSRNANAYFVYSCNGSAILQIPASTIKTMKADQQVAPVNWTTINAPCYGVGVDSDQNVWGVNMQLTTRALVDNMGNVTQPTVNGAPMGNNICPAGDSCPNAGAYTYSDFTGFGLRNFTRPQGSYSMIIPGCQDGDGNPLDTEWDAVVYDADVPPNTTLTVHAKTGNSASAADPSWGADMWSADGDASPYNLQGGVLTPNLTPQNPNATVNDGFIQVEFIFKTSALNATPLLKSFNVGFKCAKIPG